MSAGGDRRGLTDVALPDLERVERAARSGALGAVLTSEGLERAHLGALVPALEGLVGLATETALRVIEAVRAEREREPATRVALVWTGPETRSSGARDTAVVVRELFEGARDHVLVAGYAFHKSEQLLAPLAKLVRERGVRAEFFVHVDEAKEVQPDPEGWLRSQAEAWRARYWPFGDPAPTLYVDPRAAVPKSYTSLHAKCIVVDARRALVGSANFTDRAQTRNIEAGVLVEDARFSEELVRQFHDAVGAGLFVRVR